MKECRRELAPHLTMIFRKSLDSIDVPMQWREAEIPQIHKGGSKALMPNYRPAALTAIICKILEKLIVAAILAFLAAWNLLSPEQHGFIKGRSCQTNILLCYELWTKMVDDGNRVYIIFFYFKKAFNKVSHVLLLQKLELPGS